MRNYKSVGYKRRQYEDVARIIGLHRLAYESTLVTPRDVLDTLQKTFGDLFVRDNPRFNRAKFEARIAEWKEGKR